MVAAHCKRCAKIPVSIGRKMPEHVSDWRLVDSPSGCVALPEPQAMSWFERVD